MSIVICQVNSKFTHASLAAWYLREGLLQYGVTEKAQVIEPTVNQPFSESLALLIRQEPQIAAFCCYIWNIDYVLHLSQALKAYNPSVSIVLGGPEAAFRARELIETAPYVDGVISGPGEYALPQWVRYVQGEGSLREVPGLTCREGGRVFSNPPLPLPKPPPSPFSPAYFDALNGRMAYIETSRGCPFSCAFCLSGGRERVSFFDLDQAKRDLKRLYASGAKTIKLVDRTFNCNPKRAKELVRFLISQAREGAFPNACFHLEVGADLFDREFIGLFLKAPPGLFQLEAGVQSFHPPALEACNRKTNMDRLVQNLTALVAPGNVHIHIDLIAGLPYEDYETFVSSFDRAFALRPHMLQLGFLKLLPGSLLREKAGEYGCRFDPRPPYEILESAWIAYPELRRLKRAEEALNALYNSGRFLITLNTALERSGLSPYALFWLLGEEKAKSPEAYSPAKWALLCLNVLGSHPGLGPDQIRDALCQDWLAAGLGPLPAFLKRADPAYGKTLAALKARYPAGTRLELALLSNGSRAAVAGDAPPHPVTGRRPLSFFPVP